MKPKITFIMPVLSDPQFEQKKAEIEQMAHRFNVTVSLPDYGLEPDLGEVKRVQVNARDSAITLADVSFERPSCYYELGVANGLGVSTKVIACEGTNLHQMLDRSQVTYFKDISHFAAIIESIFRSVSDS